MPVPGPNAWADALAAVRAAQSVLGAAQLHQQAARSAIETAFSVRCKATIRVMNAGQQGTAPEVLAAAQKHLAEATEACKEAEASYKASIRALEEAQAGLHRAWEALKNEETYGSSGGRGFGSSSGYSGNADAGAGAEREEASGGPKPSEQWRSYGNAKKPTASSSQAKSSKSAATGASWLAKCTSAFANKETMTAFPAPPTTSCYKTSCRASAADRALTACSCSIRAALRHLSTAELKKARLSFHPDTFSKCPEGSRAKIQKAASEVFVVAEAMYDERRK